MESRPDDRPQSRTIEFGPRLWHRAVIGFFGLLLAVLWVRELINSYEVVEGYVSVKFVIMFCMAPLITFCTFWTLMFFADRSPTIVASESGFAYRVAFHEFGRFRWDQVAGFSRQKSRRNDFLILTMTERGIVHRPRSWLTKLLDWLGSQDEPNWLMIPNLAVGFRLDEVEALFERHVVMGRGTP